MLTLFARTVEKRTHDEEGELRSEELRESAVRVGHGDLDEVRELLPEIGANLVAATAAARAFAFLLALYGHRGRSRGVLVAFLLLSSVVQVEHGGTLFMAVAANRRLVPRATKSLAAREEKPAHDTARNARYILSCLTTLTAEGEARPIEGQDARPTRRRSGPLGFAATDCYATRDSRGEGRGVAHRSCRNHLWRIS